MEDRNSTYVDIKTRVREETAASCFESVISLRSEKWVTNVGILKARLPLILE